MISSSADVPKDCIPCDCCGNSGAKLTCSRCKGVRYCDKECQKRHWKEHKPKYSCVPWPERIETMKQSSDCFDGKLTYTQDDLALAKESVAKNKECTICLKDPIVAPVLVKGCQHAFCSPCLYKWQQQQNQGAADSNPLGNLPVMNVFNNDAPKTMMLGSAPNKCPVCKGQAGPKDSIHVVVAKAQAALQKAKTGTDEDKQVLLKELDTINQLLGSSDDEADFAMYATKVQILLFLKQTHDALECLAEFDRRNGASWKTRSEEGFAMQLLQAEALIQKGDYEAARPNCFPKTALLLTYAQTRQSEVAAAKCHYFLGNYDKAIQHCNSALAIPVSFNRHYPGTHKYKALAQKAKGDISAAIITMNEAVVYESFWEEALGIPEEETALALYNQLLKEQGE